MKPKLTKKEAEQVKTWLELDNRFNLCPFGTAGCLLSNYRIPNRICVTCFPDILEKQACPCRCYSHSYVAGVAQDLITASKKKESVIPENYVPHGWTKKTMGRCAKLHMGQLTHVHLNYVDSDEKKEKIAQIIESYFKLECAVSRGEKFIKRGKL